MTAGPQSVRRQGSVPTEERRAFQDLGVASVDHLDGSRPGEGVGAASGRPQHADRRLLKVAQGRETQERVS